MKRNTPSSRKQKVPSWLYLFYAILMLGILAGAMYLNTIKNEGERLLWAIFLIGFVPLVHHLFPTTPISSVFQKILKALARMSDDAEQVDK